MELTATPRINLNLWTVILWIIIRYIADSDMSVKHSDAPDQTVLSLFNVEIIFQTPLSYVSSELQAFHTF